MSQAAFTEDERNTLTTQLLQHVNNAESYLVDHRNISLRKIARLLTPAAIAELREQVTSTRPHESANALVLLGILQQPDIVPTALALVTAHRNASRLRYSAIVALANAADNHVLPTLIGFLQQDDAYHINIVDTIGSLCTPTDFPTVLPLLETTRAGLSAAYYRFRELTTKEALVAAIHYLTEHPTALDGHDLDGYLEPIVDLVPTHWDDEIAASLGDLLAAMERAHFHRGQLAERIIDHLANTDHESRALQTMLHNLASNGTRLQFTDFVIAKLITPQAAQWIIDNQPTYAGDLVWWLPQGQAREILAPQAPEAIEAQENARRRHREEEEAREQKLATTRQEQQNTISTENNIDAVLGACIRLPKEHWPEVSPERKAWFTDTVSVTLQGLDLARTVTWQTETQWTHPRGLEPLLKIADYYNLLLTDDVPIVLALRSWAHEEIINYYRRHRFTPPAHAELARLLETAENESIIRNIFSFLRSTNYDVTPLRDILERIATTPAQQSSLRCDAIERLATIDPTSDTIVALAADPDQNVRDTAFRHLVANQHEATIRRALATLTNDELQNGEAPFPESSRLDWIGKITAAFALDPLRALRQRALALNLYRISSLITAAIANIDKTRAAQIIRQQLPQTPEGWRQHLTQEAEQLERAARIEALQQTPFDQIIRKLKGATSMIRVKVFCEGSTDRPIFRQLFREIGEEDIAETIGLIHGWGNLIAEREPERYLDGCREAIIIMDGDNGKRLRHRKQPFTDQAKEIFRRFKGHRLTLHVLRAYGVENYFPQHACETVLQRDLAKYYPIPPDAKIEEHFSDPKSLRPRWLNRIFKRNPVSFYQKHRNQDIAPLMTMHDIDHTDLVVIVRDVQQRAQESRRY